MKFIIGVDCEGPACVVGSPGRTLTDSPNFELARRQATREADAAARALFDSGAEQVIVWDNHAHGVNLHYDDLDRRCDIALGSGAARWPGLEADFAGVLMIGYHPMDNTPGGVLAHTFSSMSFQWMKLDGVEVGEIEIDAAIAGERGVPTLFVASDDKGLAEARRFMPWIEAVATKRGLGWNAAISKHPVRAAEEIYQAVARAVARRSEMKPLAFPVPATLEIRHKRLEAAQAAVAARTGWSAVDPYTVRRRLERLSDYF